VGIIASAFCPARTARTISSCPGRKLGKPKTEARSAVTEGAAEGAEGVAVIGPPQNP